MKRPETDTEILEFAIWKEYQAARLFQALAEKASRPGVADLLERLAAEERSHIEKLEFEVLKTGHVVEPIAEGDDEGGVLVTGEGPLEMTLQDILMLAIEKEDASFRLYLSLVGQIQDPEGKEVLIALAQEEVRHKLLFEGELDKLVGEKR